MAKMWAIIQATTAPDLVLPGLDDTANMEA
jgi:hypothetical protein